MSWEKFILSVPESIKQVSPSLYEEEKQRIANQLKEAQKEIFGLMRQEALTYMQKLIGRLTPKKDGSYPSLKEDLFERIKDFLEVFQSRNICNDQQLGVAVEMARQALQGVQVTDLENNDSLREEIRREFEKASSEVFTSISVKQTQPIPINNQVSPISETQIAEQVQAAMDVSAKVANQKMDWADDLFSFCEAAA
jgi:hypothetical protein